jgi:RNA polymerase sigma-70 factor (ECF subfamily)
VEKLISDEELATQLQQGNKSAFEAIIYRYHAQVFSYVYRMSHNQNVTPDIVQDIFLKVCRGIKYYNPSRPFKPWLYSIVANTYTDYIRKIYSNKTVPGLEVVEKCMAATTAGPEESFWEQLSREEVAAAVSALNEIYRQVIILRFYHDMKLEEISEILNIPLGTVKSRLFSGLKNLKKNLLKGGQAFG